MSNEIGLSVTVKTVHRYMHRAFHGRFDNTAPENLTVALPKIRRQTDVNRQDAQETCRPVAIA